MGRARRTLGGLTAFAAHLDAGSGGSDLLRPQLSRVRFRWAEGAAAQWQGDLDRAEQLYRRAEVSHRQTELQQSGTFELAELILACDRGMLTGFDRRVARNDEVTAWMGALATAGAGRMLAHAVADLGLRDLAEPLADRLEPYAGLLATIGQEGVVGPVDLARARLAPLAGDRNTALELASRAEALSRQAGSHRSERRARTLTESLQRD